MPGLLLPPENATGRDGWGRGRHGSRVGICPGVYSLDTLTHQARRAPVATHATGGTATHGTRAGGEATHDHNVAAAGGSRQPPGRTPAPTPPPSARYTATSAVIASVRPCASWSWAASSERSASSTWRKSATPPSNRIRARSAARPLASAPAAGAPARSGALAETTSAVAASSRARSTVCSCWACASAWSALAASTPAFTRPRLNAGQETDGPTAKRLLPEFPSESIDVDVNPAVPPTLKRGR